MSDWKRFKDPSGSHYYFNTRTKVSTKEKPKDFGSQQGTREELHIPLFCFQLLNHWNLVICKDGSKFYFNDDSNVSQSTLIDDDSKSLLERVDQSLLALLIGVARGFNLKSDRDVYEEVSDTLKELSIKNGKECEIDATNDGGTIALAGTNEELKLGTEVKNALIAGYSSSSDDSSYDSDKHLAEKEGDSDNNTKSVPDSLHEENSGFRSDGVECASAFIDLLYEYQLDPYSTWNIQAKQIMHDPRYHSISSDDKRDELFQTWCSQQINNLDDRNADNTPDLSDVSEELDLEDNLNPTKYHYLAHIISKSNITPETLFSDIKKENKSLFKELSIKENLSKKEQEQFASKVIAYYKRMDVTERINLFKKSMQRKIHFPPLSSSLSNLILLETPSDSFELETHLLQLENALLILDDLQNSNIQNEIMYYILGIKDKLSAIKELLNDHYSI